MRVLPMGGTNSQGLNEDSGNARANIPYASKERNLRDISRHSRVLLERIPGTKASGGWRPVIDLKQLNHHINAPHFHMHTISSVLNTVERGDYAFKIDLQDAYFHVLIHPDNRKYLRFAFENKVYQFQVLPFGLNTSPRVFQEIIAQACHISSQSVLSYREVSQFMGSLIWAYGLIPLGRLYMHEAPTTTLLFARSDRPVCSPVSIRPFSPCYPTQAVAGPIISHIRYPDPTFPGGIHNFHRCLYPGLGRSYGGFPGFGCLDPFIMQAPHQCAGAQGSNIGPPSLGLSITGPSVYDRYRQYHCCSLYQQTGWDPFPCPVVAASGPVSMATVSRYSHLGQTHSGLSKCDSRPVISAKPVHHDRVEPPPRSSEPTF